MKKIGSALLLAAGLMVQQAGGDENKSSEQRGRITSPTDLFAERGGTGSLAILPAGAIVFIEDRGDDWSLVSARLGGRSLTGYVATRRIAATKTNP